MLIQKYCLQHLFVKYFNQTLQCFSISAFLLSLKHFEPSNSIFLTLYLAVQCEILQFLYLCMVLSLEMLSRVPASRHLFFLFILSVHICDLYCFFNRSFKGWFKNDNCSRNSWVFTENVCFTLYCLESSLEIQLPRQITFSKPLPTEQFLPVKYQLE